MTMKLSGEEARSVVEAENADWGEETDKITSVGRWSIYYTAVFAYIPTGKFYRFNWSAGATESQDERPFEYNKEYEPQEVTKQEKVMEVWVPISESIEAEEVTE